MPLTDLEIVYEMNRKDTDRRLFIHPILSLGQINGSKIDVRLSNTIYVIKRSHQPQFDPKSPRIEESDVGDEISLPFEETGFILHPGDFALAPLLERIHMPKELSGRLDGRSSLGRLGIVVHSTAGTIDPGYSGRVVCELSNQGRVPVSLYPLMRIAAISFDRLAGSVSRPYSKRPRRK